MNLEKHMYSLYLVALWMLPTWIDNCSQKPADFDLMLCYVMLCYAMLYAFSFLSSGSALAIDSLACHLRGIGFFALL